MSGRKEYLKPALPDGPFVLVDEDGFEDGPYFAKDLQQLTDRPGKPWGIHAIGTPKILRLTRQEGNTLFTEDGKLQFFSVRLGQIYRRP
jgi:hypothetical protein